MQTNLARGKRAAHGLRTSAQATFADDARRRRRRLKNLCNECLTKSHLERILCGFQRRGHSSAGRAPAWHAGGRRFDPAWLHQLYTSPSSRGLGHHPFTVATGVRIPVGTPTSSTSDSWVKLVVRWKKEQCGAVVQLVRMLACHAGGRGFESRPLRHLFKKARL
jgi:hypothetical protein